MCTISANIFVYNPAKYSYNLLAIQKYGVLAIIQTPSLKQFNQPPIKSKQLKLC